MARVYLTKYRKEKKGKDLLSDIQDKITKKIFIFIAIGIILVIFIVAFIFSLVEDVNYLNSIYWVITTMSTVGYGDIIPNSIVGKMFAMALMILGLGVLGYLLSKVIDFVVDANLKGVFGLKKAKTKKHVIVCGWNKVCEAAVKELSVEKENIIVIDKELHPELKHQKGVHFIVGDPTNPEILRKANLNETKYVIIGLVNDSDVLLCIHIIKEINPEVKIIASIDKHRHVKIAKKAGATTIVSPAAIGGRLLVEAATNPSVVKWMMEATTYEAEGIELMEYDVKPKSWSNGKAIKQIRNKLGHEAILLSINSEKGHDTLPRDDYKVKAGDSLVLVTNPRKYKMLEL